LIDKRKILFSLRRIQGQVNSLKIPWIEKSRVKLDPYKILIFCVLSLRTKDKVTEQAFKRLSQKASGVYEMVKISTAEIERLIYPVGFFRSKAKAIHYLSKELIEKYEGKVPHRLEELLSLPGVGRKTANLVLSLGYKRPAICVDTHVHRISNRLGWVTTKSPYHTELKLKKLLPKKVWSKLNPLFVAFGQNICRPLRPLCNKCRVRDLCLKRGVKYEGTKVKRS